MEPIVSPLWFYLFNVIDNIKIFIALAFLIAALFCVYCVVERIVERNIKENKFFKIAIIISCISMLFLIFLPEEEVLYQMLVASYITPDNIELVGGAGQSIVDYIVESVNELLSQQ